MNVAAYFIKALGKACMDAFRGAESEARTVGEVEVDHSAAVPVSTKHQRPSVLVRSFGTLLILGVLWLWYSFITFRADDPGDYATITGTLVSAEEHVSRGSNPSGHLDIRLKESALRYYVPADGYLDYFQRQAFFAEVRPGATLQLVALATDIAAPRTFVFNSTPSVCVRGVRVGMRDYCTVQEHIAWQKQNQWWCLVVAVAGSALLAWVVLRRAKTMGDTG